MAVLANWFAPDLNDVALAEEMVPRRWQLNFSLGPLDVSFPHGPRDYPWRIERKAWLHPRVHLAVSGSEWPCVQLLVWRLYLRLWYGSYRWSAESRRVVRS